MQMAKQAQAGRCRRPGAGNETYAALSDVIAWTRMLLPETGSPRVKPKTIVVNWIRRFLCGLALSSVFYFVHIPGVPYFSQIMVVIWICFGIFPLELVVAWFLPKSLRLVAIVTMGYMTVCFVLTYGVVTGKWWEAAMFFLAGCVAAAIGTCNSQWSELEKMNKEYFERKNEEKPDKHNDT